MIVNRTELPTSQIKRVLDSAVGDLPAWMTRSANSRATSHQRRNCMTTLCAEFILEGLRKNLGVSHQIHEDRGETIER